MSSCDKAVQEVGVIKTDFGEIVVKFLPESAPKHVENFKTLAGKNYYDGTTFHRVIPGFMIQGGDPNSRDADRSNDGTGGPGYTLPAEIRAGHVRGSLAAARTNNPLKRSSGSQFYICVVNTPHLDGEYTVYGQVVSGLDVVDKIVAAPTDARDNPIKPIRMTVTIESREIE